MVLLKMHNVFLVDIPFTFAFAYYERAITNQPRKQTGLWHSTAAIMVHVDVSVQQVVENGLRDVGAGAVLYIGCRVVEWVHVVALLLAFLPSRRLEQLERFMDDLETVSITITPNEQVSTGLQWSPSDVTSRGGLGPQVWYWLEGGQYPYHITYPMMYLTIPTPTPVDRGLWKHYLPATSFAGGSVCQYLKNKFCTIEILTAS